ncbi:MAG: hypothetical protein Q4C47_06680 [Planctomycetia bacterium]|nr:hypothetical protein [Planctomycetia bacterium]
MSLSVRRAPREMSVSLQNLLPPHVRILVITNQRRTGGWLVDSLVEEYPDRFSVVEVIGSVAGLSRLRDEIFDAVIIGHAPGELDAISLIEGCRGSGCEEPLLVLGQESEQELAVPCYDAGADAYLCAYTTTTTNMLWIVGRAVRSHQFSRENRRLQIAEQKRLQREHEEATQLLREQRELLGLGGEAGLDAVPQESREGDETPIPETLVGHYRELLRTYIIMGSGTLGVELRHLADLLASARLGARRTMQLHLAVLEELVLGLGSRSSRHVMTRADLLLVEVLVCLTEEYRGRYYSYLQPPVQRLLPGFVTEWTLEEKTVPDSATTLRAA